MIDIKSQIELCKKYAKDDICIPDDVKKNLMTTTLDIYYRSNKVKYACDIYDILDIDKHDAVILVDLYNDLIADVYQYVGDLDEIDYKRYIKLKDLLLGLIDFPIWYISYIKGYCDESRISNCIDDIIDGMDDKSKMYAKDQFGFLIDKFGLLLDYSDDSLKDYCNILNFEPNKEEADNWKNRYAKEEVLYLKNKVAYLRDTNGVLNKVREDLSHLPPMIYNNVDKDKIIEILDKSIENLQALRNKINI